MLLIPKIVIIFYYFKENIDTSNFNDDTNSNTASELYSKVDYNITSKNKISAFQDTIKEIKINELIFL